MNNDEIQKWMQSAERRNRKRIAMVVVPGLIGAGLLLYRSLMAGYVEYYSFTFTVAILGSFAASGVGLLMIYLQTGFKKYSPKDYISTNLSFEVDNIVNESEGKYQQELNKIRQELEKQEEAIKKKEFSGNQLNEEQMSRLVKDLTESVKAESAKNILNEIKEQVSKEVLHKDHIESITKLFKNTLDRLNLELSALTRRGNLNLSLGILTTIIGLGVLGYYVFQNKPTSEDPWLFTSHFLPRLTLVLFIEIFAYFFLKLYKSSLAEIKYFQNEMTNIEAKYISLITALKSDNENAGADVIKSLANTERNFILNKDQTTIELEKAKLDQNSVPELGQKILGILNKKSKSL